jgi:putative sigma-54 modulation protein
MKVTVTARHAEFTDDMKRYAREKALRLERYFDHLRKVEVILDSGGDSRYSAEMIASVVRGHVLVCHSTDRTAMAALDSVVDKMERQLTRFKEKLAGRHGREAARTRGAGPEAAAGENIGDLWW